MADKPDKTNKLKARLPRGFADRGGAEIAATIGSRLCPALVHHMPAVPSSTARPSGV